LTACYAVDSGTLLKEEKMSQPTKEEEEKILQMKWKEFHVWATGYIIVGLGEGRTVRDSVSTILTLAMRSEGLKKERFE
jgi:hypothetical protein